MIIVFTKGVAEGQGNVLLAQEHCLSADGGCSRALLCQLAGGSLWQTGLVFPKKGFLNVVVTT